MDDGATWRTALARRVLGDGEPRLALRLGAVAAIYRRPGAARRVVFHGLARLDDSNRGKVSLRRFLVPFIDELNRRNVSVGFSRGRSLTAAEVRRNPVVINVFNEVRFAKGVRSIDEDPADGLLRYNPTAMAATIADKRATNRLLAAHGIRTPRMIEAYEPGAPVFSNAPDATGAPVEIVTDAARFDPARYNTEFVDTTFAFEGRRHHATVRLMASHRALVYAFVRLRDAGEGDASVHAKNTPADPRLVDHAHERLVLARMDELVDLTRRLGDALGPGFFSHDLLTCSRTGAIYVCETGYKFFFSSGYYKALKGVSARLKYNREMFDDRYARMAAATFAAQILPGPAR